MPASLLPLLRAGFVEPDIPADTVVGVWLDARCLRANRFQRRDLVLIEPRRFGPKLRDWIAARSMKRRMSRR